MKGMTEVTVQCHDQTAKLPVYVTQKKCPAIRDVCGSKQSDSTGKK